MKEKLKVLQHSLGVDEYGNGPQYRNHYCAGHGHHSFDVCRELVADGFMREHPASDLSGGDAVFTVTRAGREWMSANSPTPPKLTRSQRRYQAWLDEDGCVPFGEWLRYGRA